LPSARSSTVRAISAVADPREARAGGPQPRGAVVVVECRTEIGSAHAVELVVDVAAPALVDVIGSERGAKRPAGVARGRLDPDALELPVAQDLAVRHAIERHSAGETQVLGAGLAG